MMTPGQEVVLKKLRDAIRAAGGALSVAERAGIPQTHLSTVAWGKRGMGRETASKLRAVIDLPAEDWVELLAPLAEDEPDEAVA